MSDTLSQQPCSVRYFFLPSVCLLFLCLTFFTAASQDQPVRLNWLGDRAPGFSTGVSWGVPFRQGQVQPGQEYKLTTVAGSALPLQSWPLAYWPDGSVKWIGLGTVVEGEEGNTFVLHTTGQQPASLPETSVRLVEEDGLVRIHTGRIECEISRGGSCFIQSLKINDRLISSGGRLVCLLQNGPGNDYGPQPAIEKFTGRISRITVEQTGPVRAVVKAEGFHVADSGERSWLPFIIRLYFYAGQASVKMVHTIIYDGDQEEDFIRGLAVSFDVPLDEELYNRHIRFSGQEDRLWDEPVQPLTGRVPLSLTENVYEKQLQGERIPQQETFSEKQQFLLRHWAAWNDFKLSQLNAGGFTVQKRTNPQSAWIAAGAGKRSLGMAFAGDVSGGLAVCVRNFWQSFPSALEVKNAKTDLAELNVWLWAPDAPAMDMRHYDTIPWGHNLDASYEDVQPGFSLAKGVGRTSELWLFACPGVPDYETLTEITKLANNPPLLTAAPEYLHRVPVFGTWSLPDRSSAGKQWMEDQLDKAFGY